MSDTCPSTVRQRAERAARRLREFDACIGVDVLDPAEGKRPRWTLEATFGCEYVPNSALQVLTEADCDLGPTAARSPGTFHAVALL